MSMSQGQQTFQKSFEANTKKKDLYNVAFELVSSELN